MRRFIAAMTVIVIGLASTVSSQTPGDSTKPRKQTLGVVATAHLDTQWRWTIQNTINEYVPSTFRDNFKLMALYPKYKFSFEGAFKYMLLKEYYPEEYAKLKPLVASGQWRLSGSWVDAVDVNMPSFESLVRQTLYGNGFYKQEFGKKSYDIMLPDCFGFGYALPSIAAHCGLRSFSTQKLSWGSSVKVPYDIGIWEGVDGSTVVAGLKPGPYDQKIRADLSRDSLWLDHIDREGKLSGLYAGFMYFGTGDIGGSPDSLSVDWLNKSMTSDGPITVTSIGADDLTELTASQGQVNLPRYKGEFVMTRHGVGCYSSEAAMKRWNRKNELLADATERASVIASMVSGFEYPRQDIKDTWIRFLWHQFHDDLTGTSIPEAYQFSWADELLCQNRFAGLLENAVSATTPELDTRAKGEPVIVYNPLSIPREDIVEATVAFPQGVPQYVRVFNPNGKEVPSQSTKISSDLIKVIFLARVPSVGYKVYDVRPSKDFCKLETGLMGHRHGDESGVELAKEFKDIPAFLANQRYMVKLNLAGDVVSIFDYLQKKELLASPITFDLLFDKPKAWPAWEIWYEDVMGAPKPLTDPKVEFRWVEGGPARLGLEVTRRTD
ncbi:MAG TPA: hypothetical protein VMS71_04905, partial [Candidatus Acidoferrum sp.]|nr:hypothetical protein [Candidatus Acidoferrum sp.]